MIKVIREIYCDACGRKIDNCEYHAHFDVVPLYADGGEIVDAVQTDSLIFCNECTLSFRQWRKEREAARNV